MKIDKIIRSKRKTFALEIAGNASLIVRAPEHASLNLIQKIVHKKQNWIEKKQDIAKKRYKKTTKKFINGEKFLFLGEMYKLYIADDIDSPLVFNQNFQLSYKHLNKAKEIFVNWYKEKAYEKIPQRVNFYSLISRFKYNKINITNAKKRWGSCSNQRNLNFSWRIVMAPEKVIDYVVIHELVHLKEKNHSKKFWSDVKLLMPNYKTQRQWLKKNGYILDL